MTTQRNPIFTTLVLFALTTVGCAGDDGDEPDTSDSGADSESGGSEEDATSPGTTGPGTTDPGTTDPGTTDPGTTDPGTTDPGTTDGGEESTDTGDAGTTGEPSCGPVQVPAFCVDFADHLVECDPEAQGLEPAIIDECACDYDELDQTDECVAAVEAYYACIIATPCETLTEQACPREGGIAEAACG